MHAQQIPPGATITAHPGIPAALPGLGPTAGLPVPTSASAALLSLGLAPGATTANPAATGATAHSLSMLGKPDIHRGQPDDLKSTSGKSMVAAICTRSMYLVASLLPFSRTLSDQFATFITNFRISSGLYRDGLLIAASRHLPHDSENDSALRVCPPCPYIFVFRDRRASLTP